MGLSRGLIRGLIRGLYLEEKLRVYIIVTGKYCLRYIVLHRLEYNVDQSVQVHNIDYSTDRLQCTVIRCKL